MRTTNRAHEIAEGLIRSGLADRHAVHCGDVVRLQRIAGAYYWISHNGIFHDRGIEQRGEQSIKPDEDQPVAVLQLEPCRR